MYVYICIVIIIIYIYYTQYTVQHHWLEVHAIPTIPWFHNMSSRKASKLWFRNLAESKCLGSVGSAAVSPSTFGLSRFPAASKVMPIKAPSSHFAASAKLMAPNWK